MGLIAMGFALVTGMLVFAPAYADVSSPRLEIAMAQTELKLGRKGAARARAEQILAGSPDNEPARKLLAAMKE